MKLSRQVAVSLHWELQTVDEKQSKVGDVNVFQLGKPHNRVNYTYTTEIQILFVEFQWFIFLQMRERPTWPSSRCGRSIPEKLLGVNQSTK